MIRRKAEMKNLLLKRQEYNDKYNKKLNNQKVGTFKNLSTYTFFTLIFYLFTTAFI